MKWKKVLSMICVTAMAVSMLTGCGGGSGQDNQDGQGDGNAVESNAQDAGQEGGEINTPSEVYDHEAIEKAGDITITMMTSGTAYENDFETEQLPALVKQKWPNVTLEVTKLPDDNYYTSLKTKLASGECPDIILTQPMYAGQNSCYSMAEAGYLVPLNDLDCMQGRQDLASVTYNGDILVAVNSISILGCYYNKDMFAQVGIESEPQTWDEFLEACQKLQDAGIQPIVMGDKDQYVLQFGLYQLAANEIYSQNPDYDTQLRSGETKFTDEGTWDTVLEMYKTLYDKKYIDASQSLGYGASQAITDFIDGKAAMTFDGSFNITALSAEGAAGNFERGYFPIPGTKGVYTATCLGGGQSIYSKSKYIDECKELLDYWMDGKSDAWKANLATGRIIATYGEGSEETPNYELFKPFIDLLNEGKGFYWCNQAWPAGTENEMEALFSEMVGGQGTTVEDITQGMQDKFEDLLDD